MPGFPEMPLDAWRPTKNTLHLFPQIVGKIRLRTHPRINHWWHVTLYVSPRGLTTRSIPYGSGNFEIEFDFKDHELKMRTSAGALGGLALYDGLTVADFYASVFANLAKLGIKPEIKAVPYEAPSTTPFAEDRKTSRTTRNMSSVFIKSSSRSMTFSRNFAVASPANRRPCIFSGTALTLPLTRFSGRPAPSIDGANMVTREAYSHEVISFGFWFGDDKTVPAPAFYSYTAPEPAGLTDEPLMPDAAQWNTPTARWPY